MVTAENRPGVVAVAARAFFRVSRSAGGAG